MIILGIITRASSAELSGQSYWKVEVEVKKRVWG